MALWFSNGQPFLQKQLIKTSNFSLCLICLFGSVTIIIWIIWSCNQELSFSKFSPFINETFGCVLSWIRFVCFLWRNVRGDLIEVVESLILKLMTLTWVTCHQPQLIWTLLMFHLLCSVLALYHCSNPLYRQVLYFLILCLLLLLLLYFFSCFCASLSLSSWQTSKAFPGANPASPGPALLPAEISLHID